MKKVVYCLVNFGGPRSLEEIAPFLTELLCDRDVVWTKFPSFIHNWLFGRVARKRAVKIAYDYAKIGGKSPIYEDTEFLAQELEKRLSAPVLTFHRYLPAAHAASLRAIEQCDAEEIRFVPLFPQFTYATTGSIARFFDRRLPRKIRTKMQCIRSYPTHPAFIAAWQRRIGEFLQEKGLSEVAWLFSAHGLPRRFVDKGDSYQEECTRSFDAIRTAFSGVARLAYQSKFGPGEWLRPYTDESCEQIASWSEGKKEIVVVPLSFTSDHIETLFEIEEMYLPVLRQKGVCAYRCPALNREPYWIDALAEISQSSARVALTSLIRP
ncbi:MAG: ferrochelatase [Verrucomicrobiota bacterium]|nr:ferrochelatase [Verrucomicrobiota bacterium]